MFHGFGGSLDEAALATEWRSKADAETFLAVFPNGFPNSEGIRFWADGRARSEAQEDVAFTRAILDDLARRFRVDRKRIFAVGFSNGAGMAFRLAVQLGDRIAAIAPVAGRPHSIQPGGLRRPWCLQLGRKIEDSVRRQSMRPPDGLSFSAVGSMATRRDTARDGRFTRVTRRGCAGGAEAVSYTIDGWAHHWPGGNNRGIEMWAESVIWDFFRKHPLR